MRFQPKTEHQIAEEGLMPDGIYDFEVIEAEEAQSKRGNDMIVIKLRVFDADGTARNMTDYLMEAMAFKLRHAAEVCGLLPDYEKGELYAGSFVGQTGKVKIGRDKPNGDYPPRNAVKDYVKPDAAVIPSGLPAARANSGKAADPFDDIPF